METELNFFYYVMLFWTLFTIPCVYYVYRLATAYLTHKVRKETIDQFERIYKSNESSFRDSAKTFVGFLERIENHKYQYDKIGACGSIVDSFLEKAFVPVLNVLDNYTYYNTLNRDCNKCPYLNRESVYQTFNNKQDCEVKNNAEPYVCKNNAQSYYVCKNGNNDKDEFVPVYDYNDLVDKVENASYPVSPRSSRSPSPVNTRCSRSRRSPSPVSPNFSRSPSPSRPTTPTNMFGDILNQFKSLLSNPSKDMSGILTTVLSSQGVDTDDFVQILKMAKDFDEENSDSKLDFTNLSSLNAMLKLAEYQDIIYNIQDFIKNPSPNQRLANYLRLVSFIYFGAEKFNTLNNVDSTVSTETTESLSDSLSENTEALRVD